MQYNKKIVVIMPAYNAEKTIQRTYDEVMSLGIVDHVVIVDDKSTDETARIAQKFSHATLHLHEQNLGYGANQKRCYQLALENGADIVVMVHPDYQYTPKLIPAMAELLTSGLFHCVLASRILGGYALQGGMPRWKYAANRCLTLIENVLLENKLSEYHTGYRAFSRQLLLDVPYHLNSDDFVFDNQILAQVLWRGYRIGEVSCPTHYFEEASTIDFRRSITYGLGCLRTGFDFWLAKRGLKKSKYLQIV